MSGLDDLLGYEDDEYRIRSRPSGPKFAAAVPVIIAVSWVTWWVMERFTIGVPFVLVLGAFTVAYVLRIVVRTINPPSLPATLRTTPVRSAPPPTDDDGIRQAARRWDQRLDYAQDDQRHLAHLIAPAFADVVDERLRLVHGVNRATDPEHARALVAPQLWKFITEPVPRQVTPQDIAALVAQMEAI